MHSTTVPASYARIIICVLSLLTLCLGCVASLGSARPVRAAVPPEKAPGDYGSVIGGNQRPPAWAGLRLQEVERALRPAERARLLFAELVFGAFILAAPVRWLSHLLAPPAARRKRVGFPWGPLAAGVAWVTSMVGLAAVFAGARYPFLLQGGFARPVDLPAGRQALLQLPLALTACLLLLVPLKLAHWRQRRPRRGRIVSDGLLIAAGLGTMALLYG